MVKLGHRGCPGGLAENCVMVMDEVLDQILREFACADAVLDRISDAAAFALRLRIIRPRRVDSGASCG
jgi:hypothetical protein